MLIWDCCKYLAEKSRELESGGHLPQQPSVWVGVDVERKGDGHHCHGGLLRVAVHFELKVHPRGVEGKVHEASFGSSSIDSLLCCASQVANALEQ